MFKVSAFHSYLDQYRNHLASIRELPNLHYFDAQQNFAIHWDIERLDFDAMYDESLQSSISNRLWKGVDYFPKESMSIFIKHEKEFVRSIFRDLYKEEKDLPMRISRFQFHCEELLSLVQKKEPKLLHHYCDDAICLAYLSMRYPEKYAFYQPEHMLIAMQKMEARRLGNSIPLDKYCIAMKAMHTFIQKDEALLALYSGKVIPSENLNLKSMLLALDFMNYVAEVNG